MDKSDSTRVLYGFRVEMKRTLVAKNQHPKSNIFPDEFYVNFVHDNRPVNATFIRIHRHESSHPVSSNDIYIIDEMSGQPVKWNIRSRPVDCYVFLLLLFYIFSMIHFHYWSQIKHEFYQQKENALGYATLIENVDELRVNIDGDEHPFRLVHLT